jgi:hypothetical protein
MSQLTPTALSTCVREVVEFVAAGGWDQPPQLFALVPTAELLAQEPDLHGQLDAAAELTPVAQDALPGGVEGASPEIDAALAQILWPAGVSGCALVQEVLILPPDAEAELDAADAGTDALARAAAHPGRREARVVAAVLRDGQALCLLQLRADAPADGSPELLEHPDLAPGLVAALHATFAD